MFQDTEDWYPERRRCETQLRLSLGRDFHRFETGGKHSNFYHLSIFSAKCSLNTNCNGHPTALLPFMLGYFEGYQAVVLSIFEFCEVYVITFR